MNRSNHGRNQHAAARGGDFPRSNSRSTAVVAPSFQETSKYPVKSEKEEKKLKPRKGQAVAVAAAGSATLLPHSACKLKVPRRSRSASISPSAWALSPGRKLTAPPHAAAVPKSPTRLEKLAKQEAKVDGGGVSGVWKYFSFRQKKVSPLAEEEYHRYRVAYNRLLQWRFANARAEASMAAVKRAAQKKVLNLWVTISVLRNIIVEKRSAIQKLKHEMKLHRVLKSEMSLLDEWSRSIQTRHAEGVARVVRKLSAISVCLPLVEDAETDTMSVNDAISAATEVMDGIQATIIDVHLEKLDRTCFLLTELSVTLNQQLHLFQELEKNVTLVASLEVQEKSLRAHHVQLHKE